jgi:sterol desaturase/sphingolipid hydroxylase (fatty acid hydroxylase superfamily)
MTGWLVTHELGVRLGSFAAVFLLMAGWEILAARRDLVLPKARRWLANLALVALNTIVLRLLVPGAAVGAAIVAAERGWGVLNRVDVPHVAAVVLSVVVLDLAIYLQHVMFHAVPALWRLHMVHHADLDFDVTTGTRFHPVEILLSMGIKLALVVLVGAPPVAVLLFEILLNATSMFNHGNVRMPVAADRVLRFVVVTPDMHRVHHSVRAAETNSNFGFNLPWWDRLLGTYQDQPSAGHEEMRIGLEHLQEMGPQGLGWMLRVPFAGRAGAYPINRRITADTAERPELLDADPRRAPEDAS